MGRRGFREEGIPFGNCQSGLEIEEQTDTMFIGVDLFVFIRFFFTSFVCVCVCWGVVHRHMWVCVHRSPWKPEGDIYHSPLRTSLFLIEHEARLATSKPEASGPFSSLQCWSQRFTSGCSSLPSQCGV